MARFVALIFHAGFSFLVAGGLVLMAGSFTPVQAQPVMTPTVPATNAPTTTAQKPPPSPAQAKNAPAKMPPTNIVVPGISPETLGQYGKIVMPSDQVAHPLKLKLPFPDVGEVKIPTQDELVMRDKLEQLATLSDDQIRMHLAQWPAFSKMSLRDEGAMLQRIQDFRDFRSNIAKAKAHDMGLLTLLPDQQAKFEKEYWDKRLKMDRDLAKQFQPIVQAAQQAMLDDLYREFSTVNPVPVAQAPKPPAPPGPTTNKPPQAPAPPSIKAAATTPGTPTLGSSGQ
jgi:hypothetical protein